MATGDDDAMEWADIPLFAPPGAKIPDLSQVPDDEVPSPALGALSHLLHDEETPEEASDLLRDEGNRYFKQRGKRALRQAVDRYSAALDAAQNEAEPTIAALNNRAAAQLKLGNYGHALADALRAAKLEPSNVKAHFRAAVAATHLERIDVASREVELGLSSCEGGRGTKMDITSLKRQQVLIQQTKKRVTEREKRRIARETKTDYVKDMMKQRGIRIGRAEYAQQNEYPRTKAELIEGEWCWPVLLVYTTNGSGEQSDYLESVNEDVTMRELIELVFGEHADTPLWDVDRAYSDVNLLQVYFKHGSEAKLSGSDSSDSDGDGWRVEDKMEWIRVNQNESIGQLLMRKDYIMPMYPVLHIVPKSLTKIQGLT